LGHLGFSDEGGEQRISQRKRRSKRWRDRAKGIKVRESDFEGSITEGKTGGKREVSEGGK
jgi:hypothetical protein